jgi:hypothetical protein
LIIIRGYLTDYIPFKICISISTQHWNILCKSRIYQFKALSSSFQCGEDVGSCHDTLKRETKCKT